MLILTWLFIYAHKVYWVVAFKPNILYMYMYVYKNMKNKNGILNKQSHNIKCNGLNLLMLFFYAIV